MLSQAVSRSRTGKVPQLSGCCRAGGRWGGPTSLANGFVGRLAGTTGLVLPRLTPGRAFLRGNRGCEPPETRRERVGYLLSR